MCPLIYPFANIYPYFLKHDSHSPSSNNPDVLKKPDGLRSASNTLKKKKLKMYGPEIKPKILGQLSDKIFTVI